jgi:hypothetical protein
MHNFSDLRTLAASGKCASEIAAVLSRTPKAIRNECDSLRVKLTPGPRGGARRGPDQWDKATSGELVSPATMPCPEPRATE